MNFGEILIKLRKEKGINRRQLAAELNIPYTTLSNYESGTREPGHKFLIKVAKYFSVSIDYLLGIEKQQKKSPPTKSEAEEALKTVLYKKFGHEPTAEELALVENVLDGIKKSLAANEPLK